MKYRGRFTTANRVSGEKTKGVPPDLRSGGPEVRDYAACSSKTAASSVWGFSPQSGYSVDTIP
jgi:hypothetical protein